MTVRILCPAKINTFLAVGPKDARGYHPLRTIFQKVGLYDELTVSDGVSETSVAFVPGTDIPSENTVTKALRLLSEGVNVPPLRIEIVKRIPMQSGLAGGSSDAAGILLAAQRFVAAKVPEDFLKDVALAVGADVPFFLLVNNRARGEGYGEVLTPIPEIGRLWTVIAQPDVRCGTAEAYTRLDELSYAWRDFPDSEELYNDFERVAPPECLELKRALVAAGARGALLTGSGSAVFGLFEDETAAREAAAKIDAPFCVAVPLLSGQ